MNVGRTKRAEPRIDVGYVSRFHLQSYGRDNLYPQNIMAITQASGTAELCLNRYAKFIEGSGFEDMRLNDLQVNRENESAEELLQAVSKDVARFGGFSLHVNYNVLGEVSSLHYIPFEQCRLEEEDDAGHVAHIITHPDWTGTAYRNGKRLWVNEQTIRRFHVFNPDPNVVRAQIDAVGGIDKYAGQILWCSLDGRNQYPTPIYDAAVTDISTDEGLGNIKYRNVRNNFLVACMLVTRKHQPYTNSQPDRYGRDEDKMIADEDLLQFQGDEKGSKILNIEVEDGEDIPQVVEFPVKNYDKEFEVTDQSVIERIYSQFHQELFYSIRLGKLGFSGDVMRDAYEYYAGEVTNEQRFIARNLEKVFNNWHDVTLHDVSCMVAPLKYVNSEKKEGSE